MPEYLETHVIPQFPVSLHVNGRYKAYIRDGGDTYSAEGRTPNDAVKGATAAAYFLGGYELETPILPKPKHPVVVDLKIMWSIAKEAVAWVVKRVRK